MQIFYYIILTEHLEKAREILVKFRKFIFEFSVKFDVFQKPPIKYHVFLRELGRSLLMDIRLVYCVVCGVYMCPCMCQLFLSYMLLCIGEEPARLG